MSEAAADSPAQLRLEFEGVVVTDHRLNFGGNVELAPVLAKRLAIGKELEVTLVVETVSTGHKLRKDDDGNVIGLTLSRNVAVKSVRETTSGK